MSEFSLVKAGVALAIVCFVGACTPSSEPSATSLRVGDTPKMVGTRQVPLKGLSKLDIKSALRVPSSCQHVVMEVKFSNGGALMGAICQDGKVDFNQMIAISEVDTSISSFEATGAAFAVVISDPEDIAKGASGLPPDDQRGVTLHIPIPNTCTHGGADIKFSRSKTTVRSTCFDPQIDYDSTIELSLNIVNDPNLTKGRSPVIAMVLRDPDYVMRTN